MKGDEVYLRHAETGVIYRSCQYVRPRRHIVAGKRVGTIPGRWVGTNTANGQREEFVPLRAPRQLVRVSRREYQRQEADKIFRRIADGIEKENNANSNDNIN